ncbi:MAG: hypothetical protein ABUT20_53730 [Bacteroidota bacterium]
MYKSESSNISIFLALLSRNLTVMGNSFKDNIINALVLSSTISFLFGYLLPLMGAHTMAIASLFIGNLALTSIQVCDLHTLDIIHDLSNRNFNAYLFSLPARKSWVLWSKITSLVIEQACIMIPSILCGKLILGSRLDFSHMSIAASLIIYPIGLLFCATLCLMIAFSSQFTWYVRNAWPRRYLPLMYLGCFDAPWLLIQDNFPWLKYLYLISPFTYMLEGYRYAFLGQPGIPLPICVAILIFWIIVNITLIHRSLSKTQNFV